jgi:hypothetical protein
MLHGGSYGPRLARGQRFHNRYKALAAVSPAAVAAVLKAPVEASPGATRRDRYHPPTTSPCAGMTPVSPSSSAAQVAAWTQRLVEQLQLLSEVSETLTYRLLELEERLAEGERELAQLRDQAQVAAELPPGVEGWLEETDERLARVEELLRRGGGRSSGGDGNAARPLKAVAPDPFPEEEEQVFLDEQPFLDEQSA